MFNHNWLIWPLAVLLWSLIFSYNLGINGQSQNAIGAHRDFQKTSFSCTGRPAGYYADVETGCQVYHMCDGLGRQFSYSCPNTTLFQQRMLICDHWYMVNCSRAESHYAANLLIGQRDKPFVNDEENNLRTPRPDLLDRPYAPDYSGESFRNQYKTLSPSQNRIHDTDTQKHLEKPIQSLPAGQQRWKIPAPSRLILPPAYEPQIEVDTSNVASQQAASKQFTVKAPTPTPVASTTRRVIPTTTTTTRRPTPPPTTFKASSRPSFNSFDNAALHQRHDEHDDLGTSHSTRYNTSADFNSAEQPSHKNFKVFSSSQTSTSSSTKQPVKTPSKFYEPPFLYPIYNANETLASTTTPLRPSPAAPFTVPTTKRTTTTVTAATTTTTTRPYSRPTTLAGKPFSASVFATPTTAAVQKQQNSDRFDIQKITRADVRTPTPAQGFQSPTQRPTATPKTLKSPANSQNAIQAPATGRLQLPTPFITSTSNGGADLPSNELLPPFQEFPQHDTATTQGPPIYYEWKIPSNGLEPPKLDPPYGVDGREYPENVADYNAIGASGVDHFVPSQTFGIDQKTTDAFVPTRPTSNSRSTKSEGTQQTNGAKRQSTAATDILEIRKELSVPDYAFPLENGRTGYLATDTYNSFQLKIPERRIDTVEDDHSHWFGENPKCPECHPSYVVPGTCLPCIRS